ncbi:hypothetical protein D3C79_982860 [compost metagenome]
MLLTHVGDAVQGDLVAKYLAELAQVQRGVQVVDRRDQQVADFAQLPKQRQPLVDHVIERAGASTRFICWLMTAFSRNRVRPSPRGSS